MKWISCRDRLPDCTFSYSSDDGYECYDSEHVLVTTDDGDVQIAYFSKEVVTDKKRYFEEVGWSEPEDVWISCMKQEDEVSVIAWMPLPKPHEEEVER